jgi:hypothetical protein
MFANSLPIQANNIEIITPCQTVNMPAPMLYVIALTANTSNVDMLLLKRNLPNAILLLAKHYSKFPNNKFINGKPVFAGAANSK